jgi:hypothetical protein
VNHSQQMDGRYRRLKRELDDVRRGESPDTARIERLLEDISSTLREIEVLQRRDEQYANSHLAFVY